MAVLSLMEAKAHLNIDSGDYDAELIPVIDAAQARIEAEVGPLESTVQTWRVDGFSKFLRLPVSPAISLTSVTPVTGSALTLADLHLDTSSGVVTYNSWAGWFMAPTYDVVYLAGRSTCPESLRMAVKELVRVGWSPQRGGSKRPGSAPTDGYSNTLPGVGDALPFVVQRWLPGHRRFGIA